jgi:hypothetical protein
LLAQRKGTPTEAHFGQAKAGSQALSVTVTLSGTFDGLPAFLHILAQPFHGAATDRNPGPHEHGGNSGNVFHVSFSFK